MAAALATVDDVAAIWQPIDDEDLEYQVSTLIDKASAKLRQACPFDVDARMTLFADSSGDPTALDPAVVADVVATIVKRFLVNKEGVASSTQTVGPYSKSATYVNRYDKTGSDVRGAIQVTDSDIDQLRPRTPFVAPSTFQVGVPAPQKMIPGGTLSPIPVVVPDVYVGRGTE